MEKQKFYLEKTLDEVIMENRKLRKEEKRNHIYASELGKSYYDRYLKMGGVQPSNPPSANTLRKFAVGSMIEELISRMLRASGQLIEAEQHVSVPATEETLEVTGRIDFLAGVDGWTEATDRIDDLFGDDDVITPNLHKQASINLGSKGSMESPEGIETTPVELKSINSMLFWAKKDYLDEAYKHHKLQLYTYLRAKNLSFGILAYISKDDATIKEFIVKKDDSELRELWEKDVKEMSYYIKNKKTPPKPDEIVFDPNGKVRFQKDNKKYVVQGEWKPNWEIKFSDYFDIITDNKFKNDKGIDPVLYWEESLKPKIKEKNDELKQAFIKSNNL
jgi:CRISPR/Cas system-associated exonuclease Cas4 (RecB family)